MELARSAARRLAPGYMADRARSYERALRLRTGVTELAERLVDGGRPQVQAGPFAGMSYPSGRLADVDAAVAKLLGLYEIEIAWVFARAIERGVATFVDVGCADGYYAVGMAHASSATTTYAYDLAPSARELCAATARASTVAERVRIEKRLTLAALESLPLAGGALVLCDVEGTEVELLNAETAATLARSVVVVEVHEDDRPGAGGALRQALGHTHQVTTIAQAERTEIPAALAPWSAEERGRALDELRGPLLHWLVCAPKVGSWLAT